jgi:hypothetical protein
VIFDSKLIGTKCETCYWGREMSLPDWIPIKCRTCKNRPRKYDTDNFEQDMESEQTRALLDETAKEQTRFNF